VKDHVPILRVRGRLVVTMHADLDDAAAQDFQEHLLVAIEKRGAGGLVIDVSALDTVDSYVAQVLANTAKMARLMGTRTVVVGMRPVVAATLVRMGMPIEGVETALDVDDGLDFLDRKP
jgi:rsbT antagonist protein RsbS